MGGYLLQFNEINRDTERHRDTQSDKQTRTDRDRQTDQFDVVLLMDHLATSFISMPVSGFELGIYQLYVLWCVHYIIE